MSILSEIFISSRVLSDAGNVRLHVVVKSVNKNKATIYADYTLIPGYTEENIGVLFQPRSKPFEFTRQNEHILVYMLGSFEAHAFKCGYKNWEVVHCASFNSILEINNWRKNLYEGIITL